MSPGFLALLFFTLQMKTVIARRIASAVMLTTTATTILTFFFDLLTEAAQEIVIKSKFDHRFSLENSVHIII